MRPMRVPYTRSEPASSRIVSRPRVLALTRLPSGVIRYVSFVVLCSSQPSCFMQPQLSKFASNRSWKYTSLTSTTANPSVESAVRRRIGRSPRYVAVSTLPSASLMGMGGHAAHVHECVAVAGGTHTSAGIHCLRGRLQRSIQAGLLLLLRCLGRGRLPAPLRPSKPRQYSRAVGAIHFHLGVGRIVFILDLGQSFEAVVPSCHVERAPPGPCGARGLCPSSAESS